jgi:hypothetical protein
MIETAAVSALGEMANGRFSMSREEVVPLGMAAMKALLFENRTLTASLQFEKATLASEVEQCNSHIAMAERVLHVAPPAHDLLHQLHDASQLLAFIATSPPISHHTLPLKSTPDLSAAVQLKQTELLTLQTAVVELSRETTRLTLEEQQLNTARTAGLEGLSSDRSECDQLILQKESIEADVIGLGEAVEFWRGQNASLNAALASLAGRLGGAREQQKAQMQQLLTELRAMHTALEEAGRYLANPAFSVP